VEADWQVKHGLYLKLIGVKKSLNDLKEFYGEPDEITIDELRDLSMANQIENAMEMVEEINVMLNLQGR